MILRRFTEHIKEQNWFAVGLDVIVVIVGIFLGMQVTDWNDKRNLQTEILIGLEAFEKELVSDMERVDEIIKIQTHRTGLYADTVTHLIGTEMSKEFLSDKFYEFFAYNDTFFPNKAAYDAMRDAGYLSALPDQELKLQISKMFERLYVRQSTNADIYDNLLFGFGSNVLSAHWDSHNGMMLTENSAIIMTNNINVIKGQAVFYKNYLEQTVKPAMKLTLDMIDNYQGTRQ